jgi:GH24 family phage-related lysozyme (muramidase)
MGIFNIDLQTNVQPQQAVTDQSTGTALGGLSNLLSSLGDLKDAQDTKARREAPTYTEVKDQKYQANLSNYSTDLTRVVELRDSGQISPAKFQMELKRVNTKWLTEGVDISGADFDLSRESITGIKSELVGLTETEVALNELSGTVQGQSQLALQTFNLRNELGREPTLEEVVGAIKSVQQEQIAFDNLTIKNQSDLAAKRPIIQDQVLKASKQFTTSLDILEQNGVQVTPEMLQKSYLDWRGFKTNVLAKLPADTPPAVKDDLFKVVDEFFVQMGMETIGGEIKILSQTELQLKNKAQLIVQELEKKSDQASQLLALGIIKNGYSTSILDFTSLKAALGSTDLTPSTPEWVTEAGIVLSNDIITVARQLQSPEAMSIKTAKGATTAFKSIVGPDNFAKWEGLTAAAAWNNVSARAAIAKGFDRQSISAGKADTTDVYTNIAGLAIGVGTIDFENEAISFDGVRSVVSSTLPGVVDALEQRDPEKGKAARSLMYFSLGKAARQYDAQIQTGESNLGIKFNPQKGTYNLDIAKISTDNPRALLAATIANKRYDGDIIAAIEDDFSRVDATDLPAEGFDARRAQAILSDAIPGKGELLRVFNLRNSVVYLDSLARQLEPKDLKDARLNTPANLAAETTATLTDTASAQTTVPPAAFDLVRNLEGYQENAYYDVNAYRTGYGSDTVTKADGTVVKVTESTMVTRADAERDLARRLNDFTAKSERKVGAESWSALDETTRAALTSIAYNYGSIPDRLMPAIKSGDKETIALAVEKLAGDNEGINRDRRMQEAAAIRTGKVTPYSESKPSAPSARASETITPTPTATPVAAPTPIITPTITEPTTTATATRTYDKVQQPDQVILSAINKLGSDPADVKVFDTDAELKDAYLRSEVPLKSLVVVDGRLLMLNLKVLKELLD